MVPANDKAGEVLVATVSKVAFSVNCPVSMCLSHKVVVAVLSNARAVTLLDAGRDAGVPA